MISVLTSDEEINRHQKRTGFREGHGQPDSIQTKIKGQDHYRSNLKEKYSGKGNDS